jgi:hypothetical protein
LLIQKVFYALGLSADIAGENRSSVGEALLAAPVGSGST